MSQIGIVEASSLVVVVAAVAFVPVVVAFVPVVVACVDVAVACADVLLVPAADASRSPDYVAHTPEGAAVR